MLGTLRQAIWKSKYVLAGMACLLLGLYVGSYLHLSRRGHAEADRYNAPGFFYVTSGDTVDWQYWNGIFIGLYHPLNLMDRWLGTGRYPSTGCFLTIAPAPALDPND